MVKLSKSEALKRKIRQDKPADLVIPTLTLACDAIRAGRTQEAIDLIEYSDAEKKLIHDSLVAFTDDVLTRLARHDEAELGELLRERYYDRVKNWIAATPGVEETLQRFTEYQRGHFSNFKLVEEPDRYVVTYDPCGSGGALGKTKKVATTKKAYPWSWGKKGVPLYCTHCCMAWEILATEIRGYPLRVTQIGEKPGDPCVHYYYKKPELIPEEYFTRIGKVKKIK